MKKTEVIRSLLLKALNSEDKYIARIRDELSKAERIYRNDIPREVLMNFYDMFINEISCKGFIYQEMVKVLNSNNLDKGKSHE